MNKLNQNSNKKKKKNSREKYKQKLTLFLSLGLDELLRLPSLLEAVALSGLSLFDFDLVLLLLLRSWA